MARDSRLYREDPDYPSEAELAAIRDYPVNTYEDCMALARLVVDTWIDYGKVSLVAHRLRLATGGWSGNEDIVGALSENTVFWSLCWESTHRGGLHLFVIRGPHAD